MYPKPRRAQANTSGRTGEPAHRQRVQQNLITKAGNMCLQLNEPSGMDHVGLPVPLKFPSVGENVFGCKGCMATLQLLGCARSRG